MAISLIRVDDRLIHGQVALGWVNNLGVNTILVVNDEAKNNKTKALSLNLAKPKGINLYIRDVEESGEIVKKFADSKKSKVLILVENIRDAYELIKSSNNVINELNVGGLRYSDGKKKLNDYVAVNEHEIDYLKELAKHDIKIEFRMLPKDTKKYLEDFNL